jgi:hypothetical protein
MTTDHTEFCRSNLDLGWRGYVDFAFVLHMKFQMQVCTDFSESLLAL